MASNPMNASIKISNLTMKIVSAKTGDVVEEGVRVEAVEDFELEPLETREVSGLRLSTC
jgi:hypothetical protein